MTTKQAIQSLEKFLDPELIERILALGKGSTKRLENLGIERKSLSEDARSKLAEQLRAIASDFQNKKLEAKFIKIAFAIETGSPLQPITDGLEDVAAISAEQGNDQLKEFLKAVEKAKQEAAGQSEDSKEKSLGIHSGVRAADALELGDQWLSPIFTGEKSEQPVVSIMHESRRIGPTPGGGELFIDQLARSQHPESDTKEDGYRAPEFFGYELARGQAEARKSYGVGYRAKVGTEIKQGKKSGEETIRDVTRQILIDNDLVK